MACTHEHTSKLTTMRAVSQTSLTYSLFLACSNHMYLPCLPQWPPHLGLCRGKASNHLCSFNTNDKFTSQSRICGMRRDTDSSYSRTMWVLVPALYVNHSHLVVYSEVPVFPNKANNLVDFFIWQGSIFCKLCAVVFNYHLDHDVIWLKFFTLRLKDQTLPVRHTSGFHCTKESYRIQNLPLLKYSCKHRN